MVLASAVGRVVLSLIEEGGSNKNMENGEGDISAWPQAVLRATYLKVNLGKYK